MGGGLLLRGMYKTVKQKLQLGFWPWTQGIKSRLPRHYKKHYIEQFMIQPKPVHYVPAEAKYKVDKFGIMTRVADVPIELTQPPEADMGLWGGEAFIKGYKKRKNKEDKPSVAHLWKPRLLKRNLYSEILDRWMAITVTKRTLDLIDESYGFDFYILRTHQVDLRSKLGMRLKREMLISLAQKSLYPNDAAKREEICEKYREFVIQAEEAEWVGLTLSQAERKQAKLEETEQIANTKSLKGPYMQEFLRELKDSNLEEVLQEKESWGSYVKGYFRK